MRGKTLNNTNSTILSAMAFVVFASPVVNGFAHDGSSNSVPWTVSVEDFRSTNGVFVAGVESDFCSISPSNAESGTISGTMRYSTLGDRISLFCTQGPEWSRRLVPSGEPDQTGHQRTFVWETVRSEPSVVEGRYRNRVARAVALEFLSFELPDCPVSVQTEWWDAVQRVWLDKKALVDPSDLSARRREEDGIPSAEALLRWFADNENFCDDVRAAASNRLERIVPRMPDTAIPPPENPTNGVSSVAAPAAEPRKAL